MSEANEDSAEDFFSQVEKEQNKDEVFDLFLWLIVICFQVKMNLNSWTQEEDDVKSAMNFFIMKDKTSTKSLQINERRWNINVVELHVLTFQDVQHII